LAQFFEKSPGYCVCVCAAMARSRSAFVPMALVALAACWLLPSSFVPTPSVIVENGISLDQVSQQQAAALLFAGAALPQQVLAEESSAVKEPSQSFDYSILFLVVLPLLPRAIYSLVKAAGLDGHEEEKHATKASAAAQVVAPASVPAPLASAASGSTPSAAVAAPAPAAKAAPLAAAAAPEEEAPETLPSRAKTADGSVSLGQQVMWNGQKATVRYIGDVRFAKGEWVGLELAEGKGVHDGNVLGTPYFTCPSARGVFAQPAQLSTGAAAPSTAPASSAAPRLAVAPTTAVAAAARAEDEGPTTLPSKEKTADGSISLGQTVTWKGKASVVRYIGDVRFAAGEWLGLELTDASGSGGVHNGTVMGVPYFECPAARGVFAQAAQLVSQATPVATTTPVAAPMAVATRAAEDEGPATLPSKERTADGSISLGQQVMWSGNKSIVRYIGDVRFARGEWVGLELTDAKGMHDGNVMGVPYFECPVGTGVFAQPGQLSASGGVPASPQAAATPAAAVSAIPSAALDDDEIVIVPAAVPSQFNSSDGAFSLGQPVMWNGKKSIVRYIGDVEFAKGEWVGLELTDTWGVHDGSVLGVPYFECPAGKGVFAQPSQLKQAPTVGLKTAAQEDEGTTMLPSKEKTADGSVALGQQVAWKGKKATVRYIGNVKFSAGEWLGLELTDAGGVHDGNVLGVCYFECPAGKGVFAQPAQLSGSGAAPATASAAAVRAAAPTAVSASAEDDEGPTMIPSKEKTVDGSILLGQQVTWNGKSATVRYIGNVKFGAGEWVGLELMDGKGVHDGNVLGVCYFECPAGKGVFAQPAQLLESSAVRGSAPAAPLSPAMVAAMAPKAAEDLGPTTLPSKDKTSDGSIGLGQQVTWNGKSATVRYIGKVKFAAGEWVGLALMDGRGVHDGTVLGVPYFECEVGKGVFAQPAQLVQAAPRGLKAKVEENEGPTVLPSKEKTADGSISQGQQIAWKGNKATVRYIGNVKFAAGEWLGLEVMDGKGVHDGNVLGVPYFECPAGKGVFAPAAQLSDSGAAPAITTRAPAATPRAVAVTAIEDEELETLPSREKTADGSLWLGLEVVWKGKQGIVRYIGDVRFGAGEWIGVEMLEAKGVHDGSVLGVPYFKCSPGRGIFAQPSQLQTTGTTDSAAVQATLRQAEASSTSTARVVPRVVPRVVATLRVGQRVTWTGKHTGTVRYVGPVKFATGEFVGVELDEPFGYYDGSFMGESYFKCEPSKGIFSQASMLRDMASM